MFRKEQIDPWEYLTEWDKKVLGFLGADNFLPGDTNPLTDALAEGPGWGQNHGEPVTVIAALDKEPWFNINKSLSRLSRLAVLCQLAVYNKKGGPDGDGEARGLRRSWYAYYKTRFAQLLSDQVYDLTGKRPADNGWDGRMSVTYSELVDEGMTYLGLWVDDASRMRENLGRALFDGLHILFCVEKDSLFDDFIPIAKYLGAKVVCSGKGKQSKGSTEKILRDGFRWTEDFDPFTEDDPLIVISVTDHDYDGRDVIAPTFAAQCNRYTSHVKEAHIGIDPLDVPMAHWESSWYNVKVKDKTYIEWAEREAVFSVECPECENLYLVRGINTGERCPKCFSEPGALVVKTGKEVLEFEGIQAVQAHGFEVEALPTRAYYTLAVDALLSLVPWEKIVANLRRECVADQYSATELIKDSILAENADYQDILAFLAEYDRVLQIKSEFEREVENHFYGIARNHVGDWEDLEDDPDPSDLAEYVVSAEKYDGAWRPFSIGKRTSKLVAWLEENQAEEIEEFKDKPINWQ
jgi:hypothetical protein